MSSALLSVTCAQMTQEARKAIIELLFLSLYMDDQLSLAEDSVLTEALENLGWESPEPRERFILSAFGSARSAATDPAHSHTFITGRAGIIKQQGGQAEAFTWLTRALASDGLTPAEQRFLSRLEAELFS